MNKRMPDLDLQERGEKRRKMDTKVNFFSFPSLFFLFLSRPASFMSIFILTLYIRLYKKLYYSNFRIIL